uniref:DNA repair protein XRCC4-like n=1 Tax=Ciona intestinalis TaxID=7719 RepID=UPI0002B8E114|nr:DNA repair protein XRCC4-like [Ciona intestinalis]|eukprot:XP_004227498.1 DNA repair protein XRCC4-like [Ciona intestinalis]
MEGKLHQIKIDDQVYFIQLSCAENNKYEAVFTDGSTCWAGGITDNEIQTSVTELQMNTDTYVTLMHSALCGVDQTGNSATFDYALQHNGQDLTLQWKKVDGDIKYCLGSIDLKHSDSAVTMKQILTSCSSYMSKMCTDKGKTERKCLHLEEQFSKCNESLNQCYKIKEEQQTELLSKFVLVLNEKKRKIRELETIVKNNCKEKDTGERKIPLNTQTTEKCVQTDDNKKLVTENDDFVSHSSRKRFKTPLQIQVSPIKVTKHKSLDVSLPSTDISSSDDSTVNASNLLEGCD